MDDCISQLGQDRGSERGEKWFSPGYCGIQYNAYVYSPITRNIVKNTSLSLVYQLTDEGRRSCNRSSTVSSAGSENPPNASSPRSRAPHDSLATPIRET